MKKLVIQGNTCYTLERHQKISDTDLKFDKSFILHAGTSFGKSYWSAQLVKKGQKIITLTSRKNLVKQYAKSYGAKAYYGDKKEVTSDDNFIVTTYHSFPALLAIIEVAKYFIVVDEAHNFVKSTSKNFCQTQLTEVLDIIKQHNLKVCLMTATPLPCIDPYIENLPVVKMTRPLKDLVPVKYQKVVAKDTLKALEMLIGEGVKAGELVIVVKKDTSSKWVEKTKIIAFRVGLKRDQYGYVNSKTVKNIIYEDMVDNENVDDIISLIIATNLIEEGLNINTYGNRNVRIISIGKTHSAENVQLVGRTRDANQITFFDLRTDAVQADITFEYNDWVEKCKELIPVQRQVVEALRQGYKVGVENGVYDAKREDAHIYKILETFPVNALRVKGDEIVVNTLGISNFIYEKEKTAEHHNDALKISNLKKFIPNLKVLPVRRIGKEHNARTKAEIKVATKAVKDKDEAEWAQYVEKAGEEWDMYTLQKEYDRLKMEDRDHKEDIHYEICGKLLSVSKYLGEVPKSAEVLKQIGSGTQSFNKWNQAVDTKLVQYGNHPLAEQINRIYNYVKIGEERTAGDWKKYAKILYTGQHLKFGSKWMIDAQTCMRKLKTLFTFEKHNVREGGKVVSKLRVVDKNPTFIDERFFMINNAESNLLVKQKPIGDLPF